MKVTGTVTRVVHRRKPYGCVFLAVTLARPGTHDITLKYLRGSGPEPAKGQVVTIEGMAMVGFRDSNISVFGMTVHEPV